VETEIWVLALIGAGALMWGAWRLHVARSTGRRRAPPGCREPVAAARTVERKGQAPASRGPMTIPEYFANMATGGALAREKQRRRESGR